MKVSPRSFVRELVLQCLYACEHGEKEPEQVFKDIIGQEQLSEKNVDFARLLMFAVLEDAESADAHITRLADNWRLDRIAAIDRSILRMAIVELERIPETPVKVVLNEAIELAKKFSTTESSRFVNGILDKFARLRAGESAADDEG